MLGESASEDTGFHVQMKRRIADIWSEKFSDPFLLRWLRAREFDVPKAEKLLREVRMTVHHD